MAQPPVSTLPNHRVNVPNHPYHHKELVSYLKTYGPPTRDYPLALLLFNFIVWSGQINPPYIIYKNITNQKAKEEFDQYFCVTTEAEKRESLDTVVQRHGKILEKILVLDTLEKTHIRMLNLILLAMIIYQDEGTRYFFINREEYGNPYNAYGGNPNF